MEKTANKPLTSTEWASLIQRMMIGDTAAHEAFEERKLHNGKHDVHGIGFADMRKHLNDDRYAEFSDMAFTGVLITPTDEPGKYLAWPMPHRKGDAAFLNHDWAMIQKIFNLKGDRRDINLIVTLEKPAVMREKPSENGQRIWMVETKGRLGIW